MDIKVDQTSSSCVDFLLTAGTKTFWIASMLQLLETSAALLFWYRLNGDHIAVTTRTMTMALDIAVLLAVLTGHVIFVTCVYMPFKQRETQKCTRKKGWTRTVKCQDKFRYLKSVSLPISSSVSQLACLTNCLLAYYFVCLPVRSSVCLPVWQSIRRLVSLSG